VPSAACDQHPLSPEFAEIWTASLASTHAAVGISPDDLLINIYEIPGENISFGRGLAQRAHISAGYPTELPGTFERTHK
jgi:hypothetical protein